MWEGKEDYFEAPICKSLSSNGRPVYMHAGTSLIHPSPVNVLDPNTPSALPAGYPPALPFQPPQLPAGYPPPAMGQYGYPGYPLPPPPGAGYPPMEPGYGYPPVQQQQHPPRRNHYAQSAGLVGALIGAMVIGENLGNWSWCLWCWFWLRIVGLASFLVLYFYFCLFKISRMLAFYEF